KQQLLPLRLGLHRNARRGAVRVSGHSLQKRDQVTTHPLDTRWVEPAGVVPDLQRDAPSRTGHHDERKINGGGSARWAQSQASALLAVRLLRARLLGWVQVLNYHEAVEQRRTARDLAPALDFHQGAVLVLAEFDHLALKSLEPRNQALAG